MHSCFAQLSSCAQALCGGKTQEADTGALHAALRSRRRRNVKVYMSAISECAKGEDVQVYSSIISDCEKRSAEYYCIASDDEIASGQESEMSSVIAAAQR